MSDRIERIAEMEKALNECSEALTQLTQALDRAETLRETMIRLFDYYGSDEWFEDREADLPPDLAAGVLSEDAVYDVITDIRDAAFHMIELGTDILKNRI